MSKSKAFIIGLCVICLFGVVTFLDNEYPAGQFLTAAVTLVTGYFALQVANNGVKGKFWNNDMYNCENKKQENIEGGAQ